jgi:hypothetical protein
MPTPGLNLLRFPNRRPETFKASSAEDYADSNSSPVVFKANLRASSASSLTRGFVLVQLLFHFLKQRGCFCIRTKT